MRGHTPMGTFWLAAVVAGGAVVGAAAWVAEPPADAESHTRSALEHARAAWREARAAAEAAAAAADEAASRAAAELEARARELAARADAAWAAHVDAPDPVVGVALLAPASEDDPDTLEWTPLAEGARVPPRLVLLVHGLDEPGSIWDDLAPALRRAGHDVARFDYPNDQPIAASADLLAEHLRWLRRAGAQRIDLVCHSMGGLLARDVLTRDGAYGGRARGHEGLPDVERLILLGTPNAGSPWAPLQAVTELREQWMRWRDGRDPHPRALLGFLTDGDGEAGRDLRPGSAYLRDLNARPRPDGVAITIVAGQLVPPDQICIDEPPEELAALVNSEAVARGLDELRALAARLGDGVVPVESARLPGVEDVVVVEADHRSMVKRVDLVARARALVNGEPPGEPPAIPVVLDRLARERSAPSSHPAAGTR